MSDHPRPIEQWIGDVTLGDNSTANFGIFNHQVAQEQRSAQQALFFREMYNRLHEISGASPGTCSWILENQTLRDWQNAPFGLLWLKGTPGVGKSTIMKYLWNHFSLYTSSGTSSELRITASFFCHGRGVDVQKSSSGVYRSLLHQIVQQVPSLSEDLEEKFQNHCKPRGPHGSAWDWTESELKSLTQDHLLRSCCDSELLILVDALDECGEDSGRELLAFFRDLVTASEAQNGRGFKICVSSRHYPLVRSDVLYQIIVDGKNLADIRTYVARKLDSYCKSVQRYDELLSSIASRAGENFQWCVLVVARVVRFLESRKPVELILQEIQETPQELFQLYRQIVRSYLDDTRVNLRDKKQFSDLFQWMALAKQPLTVPQLRYALWVDHSELYALQQTPYVDLHEDGSPGPDIEYLSCGLVRTIMAKGSDYFLGPRYSRPVVEFIHHSVQEYFVSGPGIRELRGPDQATTATRMAALEIVRTCVKSVLLSQPQAEAHARHPLLAYALDYMFDHARTAEEGQPAQDDLLKILNFPQDNIVTKMAEFDCSRWWEVYNLNPSLLHIAAYFDIPNLVSCVLDLAPEMSINARSPIGRTALHVSAAKGSRSVMDRLLDISEPFTLKSMIPRRRRGLRVLDLNVRDDFMKLTPMMIAARVGHGRIVERLIQTRRADLNAKDRDGVTALHSAIKNGHMDTAKVLLRNGANTRARDRYGETPLSLALTRALGRLDAFPSSMAIFWSILPQARQDLYSRRYYNESQWLLPIPPGPGPIPKPSPLQEGLSSERGYEFAQGLLDRGFDPHTPDEYGCVWFLYLSGKANSTVLDLLKALPGANINFKDRDGRTLLARLASYPYIPNWLFYDVLEIPEVDFQTRDKYGKTLLIIAAEEGSFEVFKFLLADCRSDPQAVDRKKLCALDYARKRRDAAREKLTVAEAKKLREEGFYRDQLNEASRIVELLDEYSYLGRRSIHSRQLAASSRGIQP